LSFWSLSVVEAHQPSAASFFSLHFGSIALRSVGREKAEKYGTLCFDYAQQPSRRMTSFFFLHFGTSTMLTNQRSVTEASKHRFISFNSCFR